MAKSILQHEKRCYRCGSRVWLEEHHILGGALRKLSEREGFKVWLCHYCHNEPPNGVHHNAEANRRLKADCQAKYEETHSRDEWMLLVGKNYRW